MSEVNLYAAHPAMFRNRPITFVVCLILCFVLIGIPIMLLWFLKVMGTTLTLTNERIVLRRGILAKHTNEVYHSDVRNVQISQGILQRMFCVGDVSVSSAGQAGIEIAVEGMGSPHKIKKIIDQYRRG